MKFLALILLLFWPTLAFPQGLNQRIAVLSGGNPILFSYAAGDDITVKGGTFSRASTATYTDAAGVMQTAASGVIRDSHYVGGIRTTLLEGARTNLLLNNATLSTQNATVTAVAHTLSFYGTGTVTLTGTSTAGPLVGTGAANRVSLTFTPTAGTLTLTVSGTVTNAQLEIGSFASSVIPTTGATATRAMDSLSFAYTAPPQEMSVYVRFIEAGAALSGNGTRLLQISNSGSSNPRFIMQVSTLRYSTLFQTTSAVTSLPASGAPAIGDAIELIGTVTSAAETQAIMSINGAADLAGTVSATDSLAGAWSGQLLHVGSLAGGSAGHNAFRNIIIAKGVRPMGFFRSKAP